MENTAFPIPPLAKPILGGIASTTLRQPLPFIVERRSKRQIAQRLVQDWNSQGMCSQMGFPPSQAQRRNTIWIFARSQPNSSQAWGDHELEITRKRNLRGPPSSNSNRSSLGNNGANSRWPAPSKTQRPQRARTSVIRRISGSLRLYTVCPGNSSLCQGVSDNAAVKSPGPGSPTIGSSALRMTAGSGWQTVHRLSNWKNPGRRANGCPESGTNSSSGHCSGMDPDHNRNPHQPKPDSSCRT